MTNKKEPLSTVSKKRFILFLSSFALIFPASAFASAASVDGNISNYDLVEFAIITIILIIAFFLFMLINKNHLRKIKNNKKLFLFGIIPYLIIVVLILSVSMMSFLFAFRTLRCPIMDFVNWALGVLFIYFVLAILVGIYFICKKNKDMGYGFLKLGISTLGVCSVIYGVIMVMASGPASYM